MWLETERLLIRDFTQQDIEALYELKYDAQVLEYIPDFFERDVTKERIGEYIRSFEKMEMEKDITQWRIYAICNKQSGEVMGSLSLKENHMLQEYQLGWQMLSRYTKRGYASEAAHMFAEYFCEKNNLNYLIAVMADDNPASYRTAVKSGFRLLEKRTIFDNSEQQYHDDYYYFRYYYSKCTWKEKFYGDVSYHGR